MFRVQKKLKLYFFFSEFILLRSKNDKTGINTKVKGKIVKCHIKYSRVIRELVYILL